MSGIRLLERLRAINNNPDFRDQDDPQDVLHSVIGYVTSLLNTRQGSTLLDKELGIPDFTSMGSVFTNDDIPRIEKSIADILMRYEPRLSNVSVKLMPESIASTQMVFALQARLRLTQSETMPILLMTRVTPQGKVSVEG